jgi:hypothetical protein
VVAITSSLCNQTLTEPKSLLRSLDVTEGTCGSFLRSGYCNFQRSLTVYQPNYYQPCASSWSF